MYMSESEIIGKFRRADNKKEMLKVLADLNGCSSDGKTPVQHSDWQSLHTEADSQL